MAKVLLCLVVSSAMLLPVPSLINATPNPNQSPPSPRPRSHKQECSALLELRGNFSFDPSHPHYLACTSMCGYPVRKLGPWKLEGEETGNCCGWDGIECDGHSGHVIGLDLSGFCGYYGSIDSTSSLFDLVHLQKLNLACNDFSSSVIPPAIGTLSSLATLNFSSCHFKGKVPSEIIGLTNLSSLDLSQNYGLEYRNPDLEAFVRSSNKLEELNLSNVKLSAPLPAAVANLSSLRSLIIRDSELRGYFPAAIFKLPKLQVLDMRGNSELSGHFPDEFNSSSKLDSITVSFTSFSGVLPSSLGKLESLNVLDISYCNFTGSIPSSIRNLTRLRVLHLSHNHFQGEILPFLGNFILLEQLGLSSNNFTGQFPDELTNLTRLVFFNLAFNRFYGTVQLNMLLHEDLRALSLAFNNLSVVANSDVEAAPSCQLTGLCLAACNLQEIPNFLQNQEELFWIDLSSNNISGTIPTWVLNISTEQLGVMNLSRNFLVGFQESPVVMKWKKLLTLDLRYNELQAQLPVAQDGIKNYLVSSNNFSGEIPPEICNCSEVELFDLSRNHLTGAIPECFSNWTSMTFSLHGNNLSGRITHLFEGTCAGLKMIDLSNNQFEGPLPRSLARCTDLEFLNVGNNMLVDTFPSWLASVPRLRVLILRSNKFHGVMEKDPNQGSFGFPKLQIIDLSHNDLRGYLPSKSIQSWISMKLVLQDQTEYLGSNDSTLMPTMAFGDEELPYDYGSSSMDYSMTINNKGLEIEYVKILDYFTVIDLSTNNFCGEIPSSVASLKGLHLLNLSNNDLTGPVPPFLGDLLKLEALDLSRNKLSGVIPQRLTQLNFLAIFNVSHNNLSGEIPQGKQFDTFDDRSYIGNERLCGGPLSKRCGGTQFPPPAGAAAADDDGSDNPITIQWNAVAMGYLSGFIIAAIIGHKVIPVRWNAVAGSFRLARQVTTRSRSKEDWPY